MTAVNPTLRQAQVKAALNHVGTGLAHIDWSSLPCPKKNGGTAGTARRATHRR